MDDMDQILQVEEEGESLDDVQEEAKGSGPQRGDKPNEKEQNSVETVQAQVAEAEGKYRFLINQHFACYQEWLYQKQACLDILQPEKKPFFDKILADLDEKYVPTLELLHLQIDPLSMYLHGVRFDPQTLYNQPLQQQQQQQQQSVDSQKQSGNEQMQLGFKDEGANDVDNSDHEKMQVAGIDFGGGGDDGKNITVKKETSPSPARSWSSIAAGTTTVDRTDTSSPSRGLTEAKISKGNKKKKRKAESKPAVKASPTAEQMVVEKKTSSVNAPVSNVNVDKKPVFVVQASPWKVTQETPQNQPKSDLDFPSLGNQGKLSKKVLKEMQEKEEEKNRNLVKDQQKQGSGKRNRQKRVSSQSLQPEVFHGSSSTSRSRGSSQNYPSLDEINDLASQFMVKIAESGKYVDVEGVVSRITQRYGVESLEELGINHPSKISCIKKLLWKQSRINAYCHAYDMVQSVGTLHDLGQNLAQEFDKENFEDLHLGPLVKQPKIFELFRLPQDVDTIPEITTTRIMQYLLQYINDNDLWKEQIDMRKFLKFLSEEYNVPGPWHLGVIIKSVGLPISVIKKTQRQQRVLMDKAKNVMMNEMENKFDKKMRKIRTSLEQNLGLGENPQSSDLRRKYSQMDAVEVVLYVFQTCEELFTSSGPKSKFSNFLHFVSKDKIARKMFQLALCTGKLEKPPDLVKREDVSASKTGKDKMEKKPRPTTESLVKSLGELLERCNGMFNLRTMNRIEEKMAQTFQFATFQDMGHGTFLAFMHQHEKILEEFGGFSLGFGGSSMHIASRQEVLTLMTQCGFKNDTALDKDELRSLGSALCQHYKVSDTKQLGHGSLEKLNQSYAKDVILQQKVKKEEGICYGNAFTVNTRQGSIYDHTRQVGILGPQTREQASVCLASTPLMEDLHHWSQWDLVFRPQFGDLKTFIQKYGGYVISLQEYQNCTSDLVALESEPGCLLHITKNTSEEKFSKALESFDVNNTVGHMISIIIKDGGLQNAPLKLIANSMETALRASQMSTDAKGQQHGRTQDEVVRFVLECILKMPVNFGQATTRQVYLEPLAKVVGIAKSKDVLWKACTTPWEQCKLEHLGLLLGITEWTNGFQEKTKKLVSKTVHQFDEEDIFKDDDLDEDEEQELEDQNDIDDILGLDHGFVIAEPGNQTENETVEETPISRNQADGKIGHGNNENESEKIKSEDQTMQGETPKEIEETLELPENVTETEVKINNENQNDNEKESLEGMNEERKVTDEGKCTVQTSKDQEEKDSNQTKNGNGEIEEEINGEIVPSDEEIDPCVAVVEDIRKRKFGIGVKLTEEGEKLTSELKNLVGRSLERLSKELYNTDTHFVLELIQNADDNDYPTELWEKETAKVKSHPALVFLVENDCLTLLNNECGFQEKNIRALCDVGKSTKQNESGKHKEGYIGQKGIGFKSVFTVTDKPEIHSNGYHINFDATRGAAGYILPHWIPEEEREIRKTKVKGIDANDERWTTRIMLPLKDSDERERQTSDSVTSSFHDVHPSLLLFLHRLKSVTVINKVTQENHIMRRIDVGDNIIEIRHGKKVSGWLVSKKRLTVPEKLNPQVEFTELAIAFPLDENRKVPVGELPKQEVFAFLPLRNFGFKFVVQGDFEIPSSRQDVNNDSPWNQWLRNELPLLFVESFEKIQSVAETALSAVCTFLRFVPMEGEVLEFFQPITKDIFRIMATRDCLPTESMEWKKPSEMVICTDPLVREILTSELLLKHLGRYYLHQEVATSVNEVLLKSFGIQTLTSADIIEVFRASIKTNMEAGKAFTKSQTAKWLACLYRCTDSKLDAAEEDEVLDKIRAFPIIPLEAGKSVDLKNTAVFFPLNSDKKQNNQMLDILQKDLNIVSPAVLTSLDEVANSQIRCFLETLGVKYVSEQEVIQRHIIPSLKSEDWRSKKSEVLIAYLHFIKRQWEGNPHSIDMTTLREIVPVATNRGFVNLSKQTVHFPPGDSYQNPLDLQNIFPGLSWVILSDVYVHNCFIRNERINWRSFFLSLGVTDFLKVKKQVVVLKNDEISDSPWAEEKSKFPHTESETYKVEDFICPEFEDIFTSPVPLVAKEKQLMAVFTILADSWDNNYKSFKFAKVLCDDDQKLADVESTFLVKLKQLQWIPARRYKIEMSRNGGYDEKEETAFMCGKDLYRETEIIGVLLRHNGCYLKPQVGHNAAQFLKDLKIKTKLKPATFLHMFKEWIKGSHTGKEEGLSEEGVVLKPEFYASFKYMEHIYKYFYRHLEESDFDDLVENYPFIFVPESTTQKHMPPNSILKGTFYGLSEVCWSDPTHLMEKYEAEFVDADTGKAYKRIILAPFYGRKKDDSDRDTWRFQKDFRISEQPTLKEYATLLIQIASEVELPNKKALDDVFLLYEMIGQICIIGERLLNMNRPPRYIKMELKDDMNTVFVKQVKELLKTQPIIPTTSNLWVSLEEKPLIPDERSLADKFTEGHTKVHFLNMSGCATKDDDYFDLREEKLDIFFRATGMRKLTECLEKEYVEVSSMPSSEMQLYFHNIVPYIQIYMYNRYPQDYDVLCDWKIGSKLEIMKFYQVLKLEVVYRVKTQEGQSVVAIQEKCSFSNEMEVFYVQKDCLKSFQDIHLEIGKNFLKEPDQQKQLAIFLGQVKTFIVDGFPKSRQEFMGNSYLDELPEDEPHWRVPQPYIPTQQLITQGESEKNIPEDLNWTEEDEMSKKGNKPSNASVSWPPRRPIDPKPKDDTMTDKEGPGAVQSILETWPRPPTPDELKGKNVTQNQVQINQSVPEREEKKEISRQDSKPMSDPSQQTEYKRQDSKMKHTESQEKYKEHGQEQNHKETAGQEESRPKSDHREIASNTGQVPTQRQHSVEDSVKHNTVRQLSNDDAAKQHLARQQSTPDHPKQQGIDKQEQNLTPSMLPTLPVPPAVHNTADRYSGSHISTGRDLSAHTHPQTGADHRQQDPSGAMFGNGPRMDRQGVPASHLPLGYWLNSQGQIHPAMTLSPIQAFNIEEVQFEELSPLEATNVPPGVEPLQQNLGSTQIGLWGEAWVYNYLKQRFLNHIKENQVRIKWMNERGLTEAPYDIQIDFANPRVTVCIEVKSTSSMDKHSFEISHGELQAAEQMGHHYHIYRVYNAGGKGEGVQLKIIKGIYEMYSKGKVTLNMVL